MNWGNVLQQIREDFDAFIEDGGWSFLQDDAESEEGERDEDDSEEEDPEFNVESEEDEDESESDYSDDDDDDSDAQSSDFESEEDLSEEGMSWDEMERQLEEEDKKTVIRRQAKEAPQQAKRKPAGRR